MFRTLDKVYISFCSVVWYDRLYFAIVTCNCHKGTSYISFYGVTIAHVRMGPDSSEMNVAVLVWLV